MMYSNIGLTCRETLPLNKKSEKNYHKDEADKGDSGDDDNEKGVVAQRCHQAAFRLLLLQLLQLLVWPAAGQLTQAQSAHSTHPAPILKGVCCKTNRHVCLENISIKGTEKRLGRI